MKLYRVKKGDAIVQVALFSAEMIRMIAKVKDPIDDPYTVDGQEYFRYEIRDDQTGAISFLCLPATSDYFEVEDVEQS